MSINDWPILEALLLKKKSRIEDTVQKCLSNRHTPYLGNFHHLVASVDECGWLYIF